MLKMFPSEFAGNSYRVVHRISDPVCDLLRHRDLLSRLAPIDDQAVHGRHWIDSGIETRIHLIWIDFKKQRYTLRLFENFMQTINNFSNLCC